MRPAVEQKPSDQSDNDHGCCLPTLLCLLPVNGHRLDLHLYDDSYCMFVRRAGILIHRQQCQEQKEDCSAYDDAGPQSGKRHA